MSDKLSEGVVGRLLILGEGQAGTLGLLLKWLTRRQVDKKSWSHFKCLFVAPTKKLNICCAAFNGLETSNSISPLKRNHYQIAGNANGREGLVLLTSVATW